MKWIAIVAALVALAGCATRPPEVRVETRVIDTACSWVDRLTFSKSDTPDTKRQIIEHDKTLMKNCPEKFKK
ncbi:Rz-like spanin [Ralstonia phage BOESR1]|uniref:Rz-like spanin n=1 Tax=Ralstonia phage BOESR1 TaxID=3034917 RepID=A0AA50F2U7_9CAUD|nr:Rz-like spanin [Ralstonia phage BOESR1]WLW40608.1 Rz-like spanin [Ralstonia phage BOESR1]